MATYERIEEYKSFPTTGEITVRVLVAFFAVYRP